MNLMVSQTKVVRMNSFSLLISVMTIRSVIQTFSEKWYKMVCIWSVFYQKVSIFGLAQIKFKLSINQIDFSV